MGSKSQYIIHGRKLYLAVFLTAILLLGGAVCGSVFAQAGDPAEAAAGALAAEGDFLQDPVDQNQRKNSASIGTILVQGNFGNTGEQAAFETFCNTYALPRWTQLSTLRDLHKFRQDLINNIRQAKTGQVHDRLNQLILDYMNKLVKNDKYHPAVRFNAMLMIGELNSAEGSQPTPLESALPVILAALDANQSEYVKVAALNGVKRHVASGVNNPQIQTAMLKIAASTDADNSQTDGQAWMRKQAVEILGMLGSLGANNQVALALSAIIGDAKNPLLLRIRAAESLGKLKFAGASGLNAAELAKSICQLMCDSCDMELKNAAATKEPVSRRGLKTCLGPAIEGLRGVKTLPQVPAQQAKVSSLQKIFDDLLKDLDTIKPDNNEELQKATEKCQTNLTGWLEK
jgi:hypothetical protein